MAVSMALPPSIRAWQHQRMDWLRACKPGCMPRGMGMALRQAVLMLGWAVIWDPRLQVSSRGHHLTLPSKRLPYISLLSSLDVHAFYHRGP